MKFLGMGGFEFVIILIVVLLIFGPKNLPKLGNALGKTVSNLRSGMNEGKKKKQDDQADGDEEMAAEDEPVQAQPAEITGEVETVEYFDDEPAEGFEDDSADADKTGEVAEKTGEAETEAGASAEDAAPKKVRRVVRKKVAAQSADAD